MEIIKKQHHFVEKMSEKPFFATDQIKVRIGTRESTQPDIFSSLDPTARSKTAFHRLGFAFLLTEPIEPSNSSDTCLMFQRSTKAENAWAHAKSQCLAMG
jgi:hypothetical protein